MKNEAQEAWKLWYWKWKHSKYLHHVTRESRRIELYRYRREAALERKLEAAQRRIDIQEKQLDGLGRAYDAMRDTVMDLTL